tara:strand:- start:246 stop:602 length:357 start_codon:yes stop_codon:yes gene_type:complete
MYAIVDIKGKQFKVEKDQTIEVPKLNEKIGSKIEFDNVLLTSDNGKISTKTSMKIIAKVISHEIANKVVVFKMKRRKGYQKKNGHKQKFTTIKIQDLKTAKKTTAKKTTAKKTEENKD